MKIGLRTPLSPITGYGNDGIGLARALMNRGHDVRVCPSEIDVPLPPDIADLLTQPFDANMDLCIHHVEPASVYLSAANKAKARTNIFWSMWEWESIAHQDWVSTFTERTELFDRIVAYDTGTRDAFLPYVREDQIALVQGGYESKKWKLPPGPVAPHPYTFGMQGILSARKNPLGVITAFKMLKDRHGEDFDAQLVMKTNYPFLPPGTKYPPGIQVFVENDWSHQDVQNFYWWIDSFISAAYGEGKNLPALEAGTSGTNLILSNIPGHMQWASSDIATIMPTTRKELFPGLVGQEVSVEDIAHAMWDAYTNSYYYKQRALRTATTLPAMMDWSKAVERLSLTLGLSL